MQVTKVDIRKRQVPRNLRVTTDRLYHPSKDSMVFVDVENETLLEDFGNRTSRPYTAWKPLVMEALKEAGIQVEKIRWSQKAGCSMCPCSPGFLIKGDRGKNIYITIDAEAPQTENPVESLDRASQLAAQL